MSNKELDNLFNTKLKDLEKQPSASAWDKIQAQTGSKKPVWLWLKIAATILLLITVGTTVWLTTYGPEKKNVLANKEESPAVQKDSKSPVITEEISEPIEKEDRVEYEKPSVTKSQDKQQPKAQEKMEIIENKPLMAQNQTKNKKETEQIETEIKSIESLVVETKVANNKLPDATIEKTNASTQQEAEVTGQTIEINLSDFSKTAIAANDSKIGNKEKEEEKGLGKVLSVMKEIKSEAGIGDLRAVKNEILAFNFKKQQDDDSK